MTRRILGSLAIVAVFVAASLVSIDGKADAAGNCRVSLSLNGVTFTGTVIRSSRTSCPFARNVTRASLRVIVNAGGAGDGDFYTRAWSPITLRWYRVHCDANGDLYSNYGIRVTCTAGAGARVIYRGTD